MNEQLLNLNIDSRSLDQCLKTIENLGSTAYQNICTGQLVSVPWGFFTWFSAIFLALFVIVVALFALAVFIASVF